MKIIKEKDKTIENYTVFFSWQSDLPPELTTRVIRKAIEYAKRKIESKNQSVRLNLEEATRNNPGSPDIPKTIFDKILSSDIFICDITTINNNKNIKRKTPNPNVLIELGFASAILGWERIIMIFNKKYGDFKLEVPFDLEKKRITTYYFPKASDNEIDLGNIMTDAINLILKKNPSKFIETLNQPENKKRLRDIANLKKFLNFINIPTMDEYFSKLPRSFSTRIIDFYEDCKHVIDASLFHIYDSKLESLINEMLSHWDVLFSFDNRYTYDRHSEKYIFLLPGDLFPSDDHEKDWAKIETERDKMYKVFKSFLNYIRNEYLEIDLNTSSRNALEEYINFDKQLNEHMDENVKKLSKHKAPLKDKNKY